MYFECKWASFQQSGTALFTNSEVPYQLDRLDLMFSRELEPSSGAPVPDDTPDLHERRIEHARNTYFHGAEVHGDRRHPVGTQQAPLVSPQTNWPRIAKS